MQEKINHFYLDREEPLRSTLMALHDYILALHPEMRVAWKWSAPFFVYKKKNFCYLWINKQTGQPYVGLVRGGDIEHPLLELADRKRMKVLPIDAKKDLPIVAMEEIFEEAMNLMKE
jgi:hypothetical protein